MHRLLLIDDDEALAAPLASYLARFEFALSWPGHAAQASASVAPRLAQAPGLQPRLLAVRAARAAPLSNVGSTSTSAYSREASGDDA